jgi:hypothetical protein
MIVAVIIALVEMLIRFGSDHGWPLPIAFYAAPALVALWIIGPIAKFIDLRHTTSGTAPSRQATATAPVSTNPQLEGVK